MPGYDYAGSGSYFITLCVHERHCLLGTVESGAVSLSRPGQIAHAAWLEIPAHFPHAELDEFAVMPNHLHGIIRLRAKAQQALCKDAFSRPERGSLATLIRSYKAFTTRMVNAHRHSPGALFWQRNYYERIIRDDDELMQTRSYIRLNPSHWLEDEYHPEAGSEISG